MRTLVEDIGESLGCGAHVTELRRLQVASFSIRDCFTLDSIQGLRKKYELLDARLLPVDSALAGWPRIFVPEESRISLRHGKTIFVESLAPLGLVTIYSKNSNRPGEFLGIGEFLDNGRLLPKKMLIN